MVRSQNYVGSFRPLFSYFILVVMVTFSYFILGFIPGVLTETTMTFHRFSSGITLSVHLRGIQKGNFPSPPPKSPLTCLLDLFESSYIRLSQSSSPPTSMDIMQYWCVFLAVSSVKCVVIMCFSFIQIISCAAFLSPPFGEGCSGWFRCAISYIQRSMSPTMDIPPKDQVRLE